MARALISIPRSTRKGEVIEIKTLLSHVMETGYRPDAAGRLVPRDIVQLFVCTYNGVEIFRAEMHPALAANPYLVFSTVVTESGTLALTWSGDNGFSQTETRTIEVA